jgi:N6-adenosine-specific RNA methylase IME4
MWLALQAQSPEFKPQSIQAWGFTCIILATWEAEIGGSKFEANLGKTLAKPHLNK